MARTSIWRSTSCTTCRRTSPRPASRISGRRPTWRSASVCDFDGWPPVAIRAVAGADDRFFPVAFQRALARDRLGIEADVLPGGHLIALAHPAELANYLLAL